MEKFIIGKNKNESLCTEIIRHTQVFVEDSRAMLALDILDVSLINKMLAVITSNKDVLMKITPKNSDEDSQVKSALQDLTDLEIICNQRKIVH